MENQHQLDRYHHAVAYLQSISKLPQRDYEIPSSNRGWFLKRFSVLLNHLGNPQRGQRYIHVGGTSGKGSTATMLQCILTDGGVRSGLYTSPYVSSPTEKYRVGDQLISTKALADLVDQLKPAVDACYTHSPYGRPSMFEVATALALLYFRQQRCDYAILEVGLGGRFDATNIIAAPAVTLLTTISYDHTELLGTTLTAIAGEKAGIIKRGSHVITGPNHPRVVKIFRDTARKLGASFAQVEPTQRYRLALRGEHQQRNAALAAAAAAYLGIPPGAIRSGLGRANLPCRFEIIQRRPTIILDGAHNQEKITSVVNTLKTLTYRKLYLIIALTHERVPSRLFRELAGQADSIACTRYFSGGKRAYPPKQLAARLRRLVPNARLKIFLDPRDALANARRQATSRDLILITGSFYLTGELRQVWIPEEKILKQRHS